MFSQVRDVSWKYSVRPNIKGRLSFLPSFGEQAGSLDALYYYAPTQTRMQVAQETANNIPCDPCIDASRSSSLYQDNLTEIKVNALFGLNLIKAFYPNISFLAGTFLMGSKVWAEGISINYQQQINFSSGEVSGNFVDYRLNSTAINSVYGASDTNQPEAVRVLSLVKAY